jgi:hypothetical protein
MAKFDKEAGALWIRESKQGTKFMAGHVIVGGKKLAVVAFKNTKKQPGEKTPDFRLYEADEPQPQADAKQEPQEPKTQTESNQDELVIGADDMPPFA